MANRGPVNIKLFIQDVRSGVIIEKNVPKVVNNSRMLGIFTNTIQHEHELTGEITVWRAKKCTTTDCWSRGQEIQETKLVLTEGETIFVLYDKGVDVLPGGVGTGAFGQNAVAFGGYGGGAVIEADKNGNLLRVGGEGRGGNLIGKDAIGEGGAGHGGLVVEGDAGDAVGGNIILRDLKSHQKVATGLAREAEKAEATAKSPHRKLAKIFHRDH